MVGFEHFYRFVQIKDFKSLKFLNAQSVADHPLAVNNPPRP